MTIISLTLLISFVLGIVPAILWLWFWLREDSENPEPISYVRKTFFYGGLIVVVAFIFQVVFNQITGISGIEEISKLSFRNALIIVFIWAFIEEVLKYIVAYNVALKKPVTDQAIDAPIYLISAALGFAAVENTLYLIEPLLNGDTLSTLMTAKIRFIGSTLVHVASSGLLGMFIGYSLFFMKSVRKRYFLIGLFLATVLHALFNLFIIKGSQNAFVGFLIIWLFIILLLVSFEYIKKIKINKIENVRQKEKENTY